MPREGEDSLLVTLLKALAAAAPVLVLLYASEPRVRWAVDAWLRQRLYTLRLARWKLRWWERWQGWERERFSERWGPPG